MNLRSLQERRDNAFLNGLKWEGGMGRWVGRYCETRKFANRIIES